MFHLSPGEVSASPIFFTERWVVYTHVVMVPSRGVIAPICFAMIRIRSAMVTTRVVVVYTRFGMVIRRGVVAYKRVVRVRKRVVVAELTGGKMSCFVFDQKKLFFGALQPQDSRKLVALRPKSFTHSSIHACMACMIYACIYMHACMIYACMHHACHACIQRMYN